jgi:PASTA domain
MPDLIGMSGIDAELALREMGIEQVTITEHESSQNEVGTVISQTPEAGEPVTESTFTYLVVAAEPVTPETLAEDFASSVASNLVGQTSYALLRSGDGYMLVCPTNPCQQNAHRTPLELTIAIRSDANVGAMYRAVQDAVVGYLDDLDSAGFKYVVLSQGKILVGFHLHDWPTWHTPRQQSAALLGLIEGFVRFKRA